MLSRTEKNHRLTDAFSKLSTAISYKGKQGLHDDNVVMETILPTLLNQLYNLSLINLNSIKHNYPAIDLGDYSNCKAFQITADGSKKKMLDTITMLEKYNLNETFKDITFLIISDSPKISFQKQGYTISVKNLGDVAKDICYLQPELFDSIYDFCKKQFNVYFSDYTKNIFQPFIVPSKDPNISIRKFMYCNKYNTSFDVSIKDVRDGLIQLKQILASLNEDQRWYIFKIMDYTIRYNRDQNFECCMAPYSFMASGLSKDELSKLALTAKSIEDINLGYYLDEGSYKYHYPYYSLYFVTFEEYNFFAAICAFLEKDYNPKALEKIIVDCDFSDIN